VDAVPEHEALQVAPAVGIGVDHRALHAACNAAPAAVVASARAVAGPAPSWSAGTSRVRLRAVRSRARVHRPLTEHPGARVNPSCRGTTRTTATLRGGVVACWTCLTSSRMGARKIPRSRFQFVDVELWGGTQEGG
jgi:hypothetical protein